jgi:anti-anti-sigma factor
MFTAQVEDGNIVRFVGRLDAAQAEKALQALDRMSGAVTIDMSGLEYISSAGLGAILVTQKRLSQSGGMLKIKGCSDHVRHIFTLVRLDQVLTLE